MPGKLRLTMLNSMAGSDFAAALDRHVEWNITDLDLKDGIFGKGVVDLSDDELRRVKRLIDERDLSTYCLSTILFDARVENGEDAFAKECLGKVDRAIEIARVLRPRFIRLLAAQTERRGEIADSTAFLRKYHPWLIPMYREAVDRIRAASFEATIENEVSHCIWSKPREVLSFFEKLDRAGKVWFTWDVQNLWQMGTFPSVKVYEALRPIIGMVHLKGGMSETPGGPLKWSSSLADASWPVAQIVRRIAAGGVSPVICLNPSHGEAKEGYDYANVVERDIEFLRCELPEIR